MRPSRASLKQRQAHRTNRKMTPAIVPMTIPAIAPPLRPLFPALALVSVAPPVPTGAIKGSVVVAAPVWVTVASPLLVGRRGGLAVAEAEAQLLQYPDEAPSTQTLFSHIWDALQQDSPQGVSPSVGLQVPVAGAAVELARRLLHVEVIVATSVSVTT